MAINKKLWQIDGGMHSLVERYTVGEDHLLDQQLIPYDILASKAHAKMLHQIDILTAPELARILAALDTLHHTWKNGRFIINPSQEDAHTAIEHYLVQTCGGLGKKIHTARSRNDQALVMLRLFEKEQLSQIQVLLPKVAAVFREVAHTYKLQSMPGYTHMQRAMPTTVGTWLGSYADAFADSVSAVDAASKLIDQNPLGSAPGFGIANFPIPKEITTKELRFAKIQQNPMYCGLSRGLFELVILHALAMPMLLAGRFAADMLLFTTEEFGFFSLPKEYTTGSSIMPNKQNYDLFEIMRANAGVFASYQSQVQHIVSGLPSGYARDLQLTKLPVVKGFELCMKTLELLIAVLPKLQVHAAALHAAMSPEMYATEQVYELVKGGQSFRDAYVHVKKKFKS